MGILIISALCFLGLHLGVAGSPLRGVLVACLGANRYRGLFALAALISLIWMCRSYGIAFAGSENLSLFTPSQAYRNAALPVMAVAFFLGIPGFLMANPTSAGQEGANLYGVQRITRHPFLWGAALWAAFHLGGAGDLASSILFATLLILALTGTRSIDARARRRLPAADWQAIVARSSNIPFAAVVAGRNRLARKEILDWRAAVAAIVLLAALYFHAALYGLSPYPNGWMPPF